MSVLCNKETRVLCQGLGRYGKIHFAGCREYGTNIVGGVHPGRGGSEHEGVPVFDAVRDAVQATDADADL